MAWETRGKHRYFYRGRRIGTKVLKEYLGNGLAAELAAQAALAERERRQRERTERHELEDSLAPLLALMGELDSGIRLLVQGSFLAAGYHQHKGTWRKRRDRKLDSK